MKIAMKREKKIILMKLFAQFTFFQFFLRVFLLCSMRKNAHKKYFFSYTEYSYVIIKSVKSLYFGYNLN